MNARTTPREAVEQFVGRLMSVDVESVPLADAAGRVTAARVYTDRPSPPSDVSAMDGYAVPDGNCRGEVPVVGSILPGRPVPSMPERGVFRIMTGAVVPEGAFAVIKREDVEEHEDRIVIPDGLQVAAGQHIRRRGENMTLGEIVVEAGAHVNPAIATALASFGASQVSVYRSVRVRILISGDELLPVDAEARPWEIRDSNGPALATMFGTCPWIEAVSPRRMIDVYETTHDAIARMLPDCDALILTGGVSAGTHDFIPRALRESGCEVVFHRLPQRPGGPVLGAVGPEGQAVVGLPGNPQSVMTSARRIAAAALRKRAGFADPLELRPVVKVINPDEKKLHLWWYRPVRLTGDGTAQLVETKGSGDVAAPARSDGFVEIPPDMPAEGMFPYYGWNLSQ